MSMTPRERDAACEDEDAIGPARPLLRCTPSRPSCACALARAKLFNLSREPTGMLSVEEERDAPWAARGIVGNKSTPVCEGCHVHAASTSTTSMHCGAAGTTLLDTR